MGFMKPEIVFDTWWKCETKDGTVFVPTEVMTMKSVAKEYGISLAEIEPVEGYGARLSAPGYLDCTEWCVFGTREEAEEYLETNYGED